MHHRHQKKRLTFSDIYFFRVAFLYTRSTMSIVMPRLVRQDAICAPIFPSPPAWHVVRHGFQGGDGIWKYPNTLVHTPGKMVFIFACALGTVRETLDRVYTVLKTRQMMYQFRAEPFVKGRTGKVFLHTQYLDPTTGEAITFQLRLYSTDTKFSIGLTIQDGSAGLIAQLRHMFAGTHVPPPTAARLPFNPSSFSTYPAGTTVRVRGALILGSDPSCGSATLAASLLEDVYLMIESAQPTLVEAPLALGHIYRRLYSEAWFDADGSAGPGFDSTDRGVRPTVPADVMHTLLTRGVPLILTRIQASPPGPLRLAFTNTLHALFQVCTEWLALWKVWAHIVRDQVEHLASIQDDGPVKDMLNGIHSAIVFT
jgi:hypothetical protein